ncbi:MAG: PAS domain-containing protein [Bacteriovoracaceae bacterium]|nr:PAS domain-containing protein [Bacteriovoracaceae bacterium]
MKFVRAIGNVQKNNRGQPIRLIGTCQDLTKVTQLETENQFILDSLGIGVWKFNPVDQSLYWDKSMYRLFDIHEEDFSGHYEAWENSLTPEAKTRAVEELNQALSGVKDFDTVFEIYTKKRGKRFISGKGIISRDANGNPSVMYGVNMDVTEKVNMEKSLKEAEVKLIHTSRLASLGELSAGVAHEINNPLAIINGAIELMKKNPNDVVKNAERLETISKSKERISKILNGLKKFSRASEGAALKDCSLIDLIHESLSLTEIIAREKSVTITVDNQSVQKIQCNDIEIEQALINLISNAIDAIKQLNERWIKISIHDDLDFIVLRIMDSGQGISKEIEHKLFDPFFTTKVVGEGTGLGLSITKGILNDHKASIHLVSGISNTCFEIKFPASKV